MKIAGKIRVRFANKEDIAWCVTQDNLVAEEVIKCKIELNEVIISEIEGQNIGYLRLEYLWSKIPYISLILVQKEYQGQGIGRAILGFLEEFLRSKGHKVLLSSSQVNETAPQAWHRTMGFEECGILSGINEDGIGEIFFRKSLI